MKHHRTGQALDRRDPAVKQFAQECGLTEHAVSLRLVGVSFADVQTQIDRLKRAYGPDILLTSARQSGRGQEWIAYGTIIG